MIESLRFPKILVPTDFSPTADLALEVAKVLALSAGPAEVVLVHAKFVPLEIEALAMHGSERVFEALEKTALDELDKRLAELKTAGVSARQVHADGRPDELIIDLAQREDADVIVMGTHGRTGLSYVLLGSVAERVLRQSECPVLTVPPDQAVSSEGHDC